jgi:hypothetical protein
MFDNPLTVTSIINSMKVGVLTAIVGGVLAFAIGYTITRTPAPWRRTIDVMTTIPVRRGAHGISHSRAGRFCNPIVYRGCLPIR